MKKQTKKEDILEAAFAVFSRYKYCDAEIDEIAKLAGVGKGTVYCYFSSKEELFLAVIKKSREELTGAIMDAIRKEKDPLAQFKKFIFTYLSFFDQHRGFYNLIISELSVFQGKIHQDFFKKFMEDQSRCAKEYRACCVKSILREMIEKRKIKYLDIEEALYITLALLQGAVFLWFIEGKKKLLARKTQSIFNAIVSRSSEGP